MPIAALAGATTTKLAAIPAPGNTKTVAQLLAKIATLNSSKLLDTGIAKYNVTFPEPNEITTLAGKRDGTKLTMQSTTHKILPKKVNTGDHIELRMQKFKAKLDGSSVKFTRILVDEKSLHADEVKGAPGA